MALARVHHIRRVLALALVLPLGLPAADPDFTNLRPVTHGETLSYSVEWRLIRAGNVRLQWGPSGSGWESRLNIESAGLVSKLFKVDDRYTASMDNRLCAQRTYLKTDEGTRHRETTINFESGRRRISYLERDLNKNAVVASQETELNGCVFDIVGALYHLRRMHLEPGQSSQLPLSDGKKVVMARVEAQERETVRMDSGTYRTVRYEAFVFDNVLYRRKGRLFLWLTDDDRRVPVQIRVRMPFYIGNITLQLEKAS